MRRSRLPRVSQPVLHSSSGPRASQPFSLSSSGPKLRPQLRPSQPVSHNSSGPKLRPQLRPSQPVSHNSSGPKSSQAVSHSSDNKAKAVLEIRTEVNFAHNFEVIVKDADSQIDKSSMEKLYDQLYAGVFLDQKKKKYWVDKNSNSNCFMLLARDLSITWAEDNRYWHWPNLKETTSDEFVDMAELLNVCWLDVHGKFDTKMLSPETVYEVVFVIMLKDGAYGWEVPVNFKLTLPDGSRQEHEESLMDKPRGQWIEIPAGNFETSVENVGEIECSMYEHGGHWKNGLVIQGVTIRPKVVNGCN